MGAQVPRLVRPVLRLPGDELRPSASLRPRTAAARLDSDHGGRRNACADAQGLGDHGARLDLRPSPSAPPDFTRFVTRGGGSPELAARLWNEGIDREGAVDALNLAMTAPDIDDFGPARLLVEILSWTADGPVSAEEVQAGFRALADAVVVQPDGRWVRAADGAPLQVSPVALREGRLFAGDLPVGGLYPQRAGVLRALGPRGQPGEVVSELGLDRDPVSAFVRGTSEATWAALRALPELAYGLVHHPEETLTGLVHAAGTLPDQAVKVAFDAPETARRFAGLPADEQLRLAGKLFATALLAKRAGKVAGAASRGAPLSQLSLRIRLADLGAGRVLPWIEVEGLRAAVPAGLGLAAGLGATQATLRVRDGDLDEPKIRFANEHHIGRTVGDPRGTSAKLDDVADNLRLLEEQPVNTQRTYAKMARAHLEATHPSPTLDDVTRLFDRLGDVAPEARAELHSWAHPSFRRAIDEVGDARTAANRARIEAIRQRADAAGIDLHAAYRSTRPAPPLESLSMEAQKAVRAIDGGSLKVRVRSRRIAEEILSQFPDYAHTGGRPKWKTKALFEDEFVRTYHWDDVRGPDGNVAGHGPTNPHRHLPHLQFTADKNKEIHVFFPW